MNQLEAERAIYFSYNPTDIKGISLRLTENNFSNLLDELADQLRANGLLLNKVDERFYVVKKESSRFVKFVIRDGETNELLPYAMLRLEQTDLGKVADLNGELNIIVDRPSTAILNITFLGFEDQRIAADSLADLSVHEVFMQPVTTALTQIEVKEYLNVGIASDPIASSFKIFPHSMEIIPGLSERDVLLSAQMIAGFASNDESAAGINLRGSARDNTLLYWNNIPIYHTAHYFGHISSFIPSSIGEMNLYKNYIPVKYGGAAAGIIDLSSRNPIDKKLTGEASLNLTHADLYLKLPFKQDLGSIMLAGRRSFNDLVPTWTYKSYETKLFSSTISDEDEEEIEEGEADNELGFSDVNLQWIYAPNSATQLSASLVRSQSQFNYSERDHREKRNFDQTHNIRSRGYNMSFQKRLSDSYSIDAYGSYSGYEMGYESRNLRRLDDPSDDDFQSRENKVSNLELRITNTHRIGDANWISWGYQMNTLETNSSINSDNFIEQNNADTLDATGLVNAGFVDLSLVKKKKIEVVLSSRVTHLNTLNSFFYSPQVKMNYRLNDALIFKSTYGIYHQYLSTIKERDFTLSNAVEQVWLLADEATRVPVIINKQWTAGFLYEAENWLVDLDLYQKSIDGILARNLGFATRNEDGFQQGSEQLFGVDLTLRKRWRYFRLWTTYSFQDSEVRFPNLFPMSIPSSLNIRHQLRLSAAYSLASWEFSMGYSFKSGLPFTNVNDIVIRDQDGRRPPPGGNRQNQEDFFFLEYQSPNSSRLPNYHRVDASIWHRWNSNRLKGEIGLSLINIFDQKNVFDVDYYIEKEEADEDGEPDELEIYKRTKYFLRFTPNLTFRLIF